MNFWRTTLFWCNFNSLNGHASFEVFWPENTYSLSPRCDNKHCIWATFNDGLYLKDIRVEKFELIHHWEK